MKSKYLFPTWCSLLGYVMALPGFVLGYLYTIENYKIPGFGFKMREKGDIVQSAFENFTNELSIFLVVIGLLLIAFSKSKKEDELMAKLRLSSLYWSVVIYYAIYNFGFLFINFFTEIPFISQHILELNVFTPLLVFIVRFHYLRYRSDQFLVNKPKFFPNTPFKPIGVVLTLLGLSGISLTFVKDGVFFAADEELTIGYFIMVLGLLIWSFSKHKIEDEMAMQQRLESLQLAVYFNYGLLLTFTLLFYSLSYLMVMMFAQFSLLLFFVIRMEFVNYRNNQLLSNAEGEFSHEK